MDLYRRIASIRTNDDASDVLDELIDRYGEPPKPVLALLDVALLRAAAVKAGVGDISQRGDKLKLRLDVFHPAALSAVCAMPKYRRSLLHSGTDTPTLTQTLPTGADVLETALTGSAALPDGPLKLESDSFYGTTWSSAGAGWVKPDSIYTWVDGDGFTVTAYHTGAAQPGVLYDRSKLAVKDKYSMFLGGNQPLCVISNPEASGGKLLVIRDSYADSLAPFLAQDWQEVHLWDLRYNLNSLKQYIADNGIDQVLVLYSAANFASDANLFLLGL